MFIQYFYFHYLLQYYHYSLPPYSEDITLILYQFLSVALYHFTSVANNKKAFVLTVNSFAPPNKDLFDVIDDFISRQTDKK
ncbi:MAG: hypothetical protein LN546_02035, partial [Rickettsia endosymbiont of Ecitomorpha arachnoides]|nr:hypothetical protein [Rickettsia endosymbiont of Ecitomorpha arachnoides]